VTTAAPSAALVTIRPAVTGAGRFALAGFLAGYRGLTRDACAAGRRQCASWRRARPVTLSAVRRAGLEGLAREPEASGRARATVTRRLSTIAGSGKYAGQEELPGRSPAAAVRRPRIGCQSGAAALDRGQPGALLVAAGPGCSWPRLAGGRAGTARGGSSARPPAVPGSPRTSRPARCGPRSSPPPWMAGCRSAMSRGRLPIRIRGPRCGMTGAAAAWTGTPGPSSPPALRAPPGNAGRLTSASPAGYPPGEAAPAADPVLATATDRNPQSERDPPIWRDSRPFDMAVRGAPNRLSGALRTLSGALRAGLRLTGAAGGLAEWVRWAMGC